MLFKHFQALGADSFCSFQSFLVTKKIMLKSLKIKLKSIFALPTMATLIKDNYELMDYNERLIDNNYKLMNDAKKLMDDNYLLMLSNDKFRIQNSQLELKKKALTQENTAFYQVNLKLKSIVEQLIEQTKNSDYPTNFERIFCSKDVTIIKKIIEKYPGTKENWQNLSHALVNSDIDNILQQLALINHSFKK